MTTVVTKYTAPGAAGAEVDARATRYVSEHHGVTYQEAIHAVLKADRQLAEAYSRPAARVTLATAGTRSQPVVPVTAGDERETLDWVDIRRNAPETAAAQSPGDVVHNRVQALIAKHQHMNYHGAMSAVLAEDPALKARYAGVQHV